jgi:hypothetical protein
MGIAKPSFEALQLPVSGLAFHHRFDLRTEEAHYCFFAEALAIKLVMRFR